MNTDISILLDRSGSMASVKADTIGGFNTFLVNQRKVTGACTLTLCQFDDVSYDYTMLAQPLVACQDLNDTTFVPRGGTPLLDSMARLITETGARLNAMPQAFRPEKVIVVIITDGLENSSRHHTREQVLAMVKHQHDVYKWDFLYLGANQDAIAEARSFGINEQYAAMYSGTPIGTRKMYDIASDKMRIMRSGGSGAITATDRDELAKDDE